MTTPEPLRAAACQRDTTNVIMRTCGWCETVHPEHVSIEWLAGERLHFCTDTCLKEFGEYG